MNLEEILHWTVVVCVAYLALVYVSYFALAFAGLVENSTRRRESAAEDYETIASSRFTIPVTVILAAYNEESAITPTVRSLLAQTYPEFEVIVVNDGSTDGGQTEAIAQSFGGRIRYFSKPNGHVASALNFGIREMRGAYFSWLSHDDLYKADKIERQMAVAAAGDAETIFYCDFEVLEVPDGKLTPVRLPPQPPEHFRWYLATANSLHGCTLLIPKHCLDECGPFDEALKTTQDYDMWFRLARRCRFVHVPGIFVTSRHHAAQGTVALKDVAVVEIDRLLARFAGELAEAEVMAATGKRAHGAFLALAANLHCRGFAPARDVALARALGAARRRSRLAGLWFPAQARLAFWVGPWLAQARWWLGTQLRRLHG